MSDDPMPASFVWTGDDDEMQKVPDGPALGNYPARTIGSSLPWERGGLSAKIGDFDRKSLHRDRRATVGEKLARFLNDLADSVRGWH